ncbi:MAG: hypothetical protein QOD28_2729 [Acidobacteriota bacterium]|nr:hypothetical protein [Acidobacteriota bacterium]
MKSIPELVQWIGTNPWLSVLSFIITLLSIILAVFFYLKSKRSKLPCYSTRNINIIRDLVSRIESLEMLYDSHRIENLTVTKFAFWNGGSETIGSQDVASSDPVSFQVVEGCEILKAQKLYEKNSANKFALISTSNNSQHLIEFEYIDKDEGAVFQFLHTGKSNQDIIVSGTIKGAGKLVEKNYSSFEKWLLKVFPFAKIYLTGSRAWIVFLFFFFPMLAVILLLFGAVKSPSLIGHRFISLMIASLITVLLYWIVGYKILQRLMPKGFEILEEDFEDAEVKKDS